MSDVPWMFLRRAGGVLLARNVDLTVEGLPHLPPRGPVILAARHYHHLYDGCAILGTVDRPAHILVGLDWVRNRAGRLVMDRACAAARWPVVLRNDPANPPDPRIAARALRTAMRDALALFEEGRILLVFPEGYPNIDPGYTPKGDDAAFLPFEPGFVRLATLAASRGIEIPIVPVGIQGARGDRWAMTIRFGEPVLLQHRREEEDMLREVETHVRALSGA